jgi:flagellar FliJ protein
MRSRRLSKVAALAKTEERRQCQEMGHAQRQLDAELKQLEELRRYRESYLSRRGNSASISKHQWQDYHRFLERMDQAVDAQEQLVAESRRNRDLQRRRWIKNRQRLDSLQRVVERHRRAEQIDAERREQREQDDLPPSPDYYGEH